MCMKKIVVSLISLLLVLYSFIAPCVAAQGKPDIIYLEDGSYYVISLNAVQVSRATNSIRGQKIAEYHDQDGTLLWTFVLTASFTYNPGISATCTSADCSVDIYNSAWSCSSKSARAISARAFGDVEMIQKFLLVTVNTVPVSLNITCDNNGNLS